MTSYLIAGPGEEPVSLAEAKAFCRIDGTDEDALTSALIAAARLHVESVTGRAMITQTWRLVVECPVGRVIPLPVVPGNRVMLLDGRVGILPVPSAWLDATAELRSFAGGSDAIGVLSEVAIDRAAILPLMPVHLHAEPVAGGDIELSWVRRSRADSDGWAADDAPLDWSPESYRLEIYDGAVLVRSLDVSAPSATYAAAEQTADFGAPPSSFVFKVAQLSAPYGPGHWAEGEFNA